MNYFLYKIAKEIRTGLIFTGLMLTAPLIAFGVAANTDKLAEKTQAPTNSNYTANFFAQYQPQSALDMIEKLPGFTFDGGDNARGFGGNAGNVLIDGARPTSKSGGLAGALKRIPAAQIMRIEILRGGVGAGEASGQSIVANVVKFDDVTSGTWAVKFRRSPDGTTKPNIEAAVSTKVGLWNVAFDIDLGQGPNSRTAKITEFDQYDQEVMQENEQQAQLGQFAFSNTQFDREFDNAKLTLNGRIGTDTWSSQLIRDIVDTSIAQTSVNTWWQLDERSTYKIAELGVDWVESFDDWKWHSLGLFQQEDSAYRNMTQDTESNVLTNVSNFSQNKLQQEFILRNTYGYTGVNQFKPEFGVEFANNTLEAELDFIADGIEQALANANVTVEELRGELFASFVYVFTQEVTFEGGITAEFSQIEVSGGNAKKQQFEFLKPRLAVNYKLSNELSLSLEAQHSVGQLNFNDFAASSSAEDERDISGNSDLVPEQVSQVSATMDWRFSEKGSVKVELYHHWHDDILEAIFLESGGAGIGNAGDSRMWGFDTHINLPIDSIIDNGLVEINYNYRDTEFFDSIINRNRKTSYYLPHNLYVQFRQDLTELKMAWGLEYYNHFTEKAYYVDEIATFEGNDRFRLFVETSYIDGLKIQLEVDNANTGEFTRTRTFYDDNRGGAYAGKQLSQRVRHPSYKLSVWGTF